VIFRVVFLGFLSTLIVYICGKEEDWAHFFHDSISFTFIGDRFPYESDKNSIFDKSYVFSLIFSTALFAVIHVPGYGNLKLIQTIFLGVLLGLLFLRYGITASLFFHLLHNFVLITTYFLDYSTFVQYTILLVVLIILIFLFETLYPWPDILGEEEVPAKL
jgi:hypothetical protein